MTAKLNNNDWTTISPYHRFFNFIDMDADRYNILLELIGELGLNSTVITIEGKRHFFIFPMGYTLKLAAGMSFPFSGQNPVVLVAHYDRAAGSPGANDNSAAVFQLLLAAQKLSEQGTDY